MRRATIAAFLACALVASHPHSRAQSQTPMSAEEVDALLQKSLAATNLKFPGKQPLHLSATVKYKALGGSETGRFEIFFAAPDRYRENLNIGKITETDIASGDKLYVARSTKTLSAEFWRTSEFVWYPGAGLQTLQEIVERGKTSFPSIKVANNCEDESDRLSIRQACFDPATHEIVSFTIRDSIGSPINNGAVSLNDFKSIGANRYPGHLTRKSVWDSIDVSVDSLTLEGKFDENTFVPPVNAVTRDWCVAPQETAPSNYQMSRRTIIEGVLLVYYVLVGPDGRAKNVVFLNDPLNSARSMALASAKGKPYPVHTCGGKPIEYETIVITNVM